MLQKLFLGLFLPKWVWQLWGVGRYVTDDRPDNTDRCPVCGLEDKYQTDYFLEVAGLIVPEQTEIHPEIAEAITGKFRCIRCGYIYDAED